MKRLILVGSPRENGRSASLADQLFEACIEEYPDDEVTLAPVSTLTIEPCAGCDACRNLVKEAQAEMRKNAQTTKNAQASKNSQESNHSQTSKSSQASKHSQATDNGEEIVTFAGCCVIDDDMTEIYELIDTADELIVVSPVYFAGPPAQFKALIDRMQLYFWTDLRKGPKRPATLHVIGEGDDPYGFDPLVGIVRSAFSTAGFQLERILDWVGKMSPDGEILEEADEYLLNEDGDFIENELTGSSSEGGYSRA